MSQPLAPMPMRFSGTAHPPADRRRVDPADLSSAEIAAGNLGSRGPSKHPTPVLVEHDGAPVGRVLASYQAPNGSLRVHGSIHDGPTADAVRAGTMRGLSLGTRVHHDPTDVTQVKVRAVEELSVVEVPRRQNCWIDEIDGRRIPQRTDRASARGGVSRPPCPP